MPDPNDTSMGTLSLIFGILGCVGILPCIGALIAVITGRSSRGTAGESNGRIGGILGWIGMCIYIIAAVMIPLAIFVFSWITI